MNYLGSSKVDYSFFSIWCQLLKKKNHWHRHIINCHWKAWNRVASATHPLIRPVVTRAINNTAWQFPHWGWKWEGRGKHPFPPTNEAAGFQNLVPKGSPFGTWFWHPDSPGVGGVGISTPSPPLPGMLYSLWDSPSGAFMYQRKDYCTPLAHAFRKMCKIVLVSCAFC